MLRTIFALWVGVALSTAGAAQVRGEADALAAAERLLEHAGGRAAWAKARTFYVEERAFLPSGEIADLRIWRDLNTGNRRLERTTASSRFAEWLSPSAGWEIRNGQRSAIPPHDLIIELQGLQQEPYAIYRRLARNDPALRVQKREDTLYVYDRDERLLCWFVLGGDGTPRSWGNFWNGSINQHYYGPIADMGDANLPKWGVSTTGSFRFEYVRAALDARPVEPPLR